MSMDLNVVNERLALDELEIWEIYITINVSHNFHIHATHFRIIKRDGSEDAVAANEKGYKDVVYLPPNARVTLALKMTDYRDENIPYMYHCHFLEHDDAGMMGSFWSYRYEYTKNSLKEVTIKT